MFYFLLFTGTAMILSGIRGMQKERKRERQQFFAAPESDGKPAEKALNEDDQFRVADLTERMAEMEKSLFDHLLKWQMEKEELLEKIRTEKLSSVKPKTQVQKKKVEKENSVEIEVKEETEGRAEEIEKEETAEKDKLSSLETKKKPMPDNIRRVVDYENEGLSIQEIANITRMNKGEVLLLRNLSKHYRK